MRFLRPKDVVEKTRLSRPVLYRLIKKGLFPRPVKILPNVSIWLDIEVEEVMLAMYRKADNQEIENLVRKLEESRKNLNLSEL